MTYSIAACDLDAGQWGVATQSKFLAVGSVVTWAEPGVGAIATQALREPAVRPRRPAPAARRARRAGGHGEPRLRGRRPRAPAARRRRRAAASARATPASECMDWAGGTTGTCFAAQGNILVSGETVDALAARSCRSDGRAARRAAARCARRGAGGGRRPPRPAVGGAARRRERRRLRGPVRLASSTCASTTTRRRSTSCAGSTSSTSCSSARRPPTSGSTSTTTSPPSCASGSRGSATTARWTRRSTSWAGTENLEERVNGVDADRPGRARGAARR